MCMHFRVWSLLSLCFTGKPCFALSVLWLNVSFLFRWNFSKIKDLCLHGCRMNNWHFCGSNPKLAQRWPELFSKDFQEIDVRLSTSDFTNPNDCLSTIVSFENIPNTGQHCNPCEISAIWPEFSSVQKWLCQRAWMPRNVFQRVMTCHQRGWNCCRFTCGLFERGHACDQDGRFSFSHGKIRDLQDVLARDGAPSVSA